MNPKHNEQLGQLKDSEYLLLHRDLQLVSLEAGQNLFMPGGAFDHVFFPLNALIAVANESSDGLCIDIATVGLEVCAGLLGLFKDKCPYRVYVAHSGLGYKIALSKVRPYFDASGGWVNKMYVQANFHMLSQIAAETTCAHFHTLPERLSKWLLRRTELIGESYLEVTHRHVAESLGVRREAVTTAFSKLPGLKLHRNRIHVVDRSALERGTCASYQSIHETMSGQKTLRSQ